MLNGEGSGRLGNSNCSPIVLGNPFRQIRVSKSPPCHPSFSGQEHLELIESLDSLMQPPLRQPDPRGEAIEGKQKEPHLRRACPCPQHDPLGLSSLRRDPTADSFPLPVALGFEGTWICALSLGLFLSLRTKVSNNRRVVASVDFLLRSTLPIGGKLNHKVNS